MIPKSNVWYHKGEAREAINLSCFLLRLEFHDGTIADGYYYCGQFYRGFEKVTNYVHRWMIPYKGEEVRPS